MVFHDAYWSGVDRAIRELERRGLLRCEPLGLYYYGSGAFHPSFLREEPAEQSEGKFCRTQSTAAKRLTTYLRTHYWAARQCCFGLFSVAFRWQNGQAPLSRRWFRGGFKLETRRVVSDAGARAAASARLPALQGHRPASVQLGHRPLPAPQPLNTALIACKWLLKNPIRSF